MALTVDEPWNVNCWELRMVNCCGQSHYCL